MQEQKGTVLLKRGEVELEISRIGLGAMTWGDASKVKGLNPAKLAYGDSGGRKAEEEAFEVSLSAGVNWFDTAEMYSAGQSELRLGELRRGQDLVIASKFPPKMFSHTDDFPRELEQSLVRLATPVIDIFQHHFPSSRVKIPQLMHRMADAVEQGKIRFIGVSNYTAEQVRLASDTLKTRGQVLSTLQVQYSLLHRKPEVNGLLELCRERSITLIAYQPLASGALTGKYSSSQRPAGFRRFMPFFSKTNLLAMEPLLNALKRIGAKYGKSSGQVALRWLIQQPLVVAIPGAKNAQQARENAGALSFSLTSDEWEELELYSRPWKR